MAQPTADFGNRSVAAMRSKVYAGIKRKSTDPLSGLSTTSIDDYIATWDAYFCDYARWTFRRTSKMLLYWGRTTLYDALATDDTYIELTTNADIPASGRLAINQDEIDYTDKNTPTSGRSVLIATAADAKTPDVSHVAGEEVNFLVAAPEDFGKPGELWYGDSVNPCRSKLQHLDNRQFPWPPTGRYFFNDGYFYLPKGMQTARLFAVYYKKAKKPAAGDDLQTPEKYDRFVYLCAMAECYKVMGNDSKANELFLDAGVPTLSNSDPVGILQTAAANDAEQTDSLDDIFVPR